MEAKVTVRTEVEVHVEVATPRDGENAGDVEEGVDTHTIRHNRKDNKGWIR